MGKVRTLRTVRVNRSAVPQFFYERLKFIAADFIIADDRRRIVVAPHSGNSGGHSRKTRIVEQSPSPADSQAAPWRMHDGVMSDARAGGKGDEHSRGVVIVLASVGNGIILDQVVTGLLRTVRPRIYRRQSADLECGR